MITTKTLPLVLKAATATMPASVVGQRPTIAMVTAINNNQKAVLSTDAQNAPVNLQTTNKVTGPGAEAVQIVTKNTVTLVSVSSVCPADRVWSVGKKNRVSRIARTCGESSPVGIVKMIV